MASSVIPVERTCGQPDARTAAWAEQIMLGVEYGDADNVAARWIRSPSLSVFGATTAQDDAVRATVEQLNDVLASTPLRGITLLPANDTTADIQVYFAPLRQFWSLSIRLGFPYYPENWGYFWWFRNGRFEIQRAFVLLASDKLHGPALRHFTLEEITQSLGLSNDSPLYPESIFYARGDDGGSAQRLSALDRTLITFFYSYVAPRDGPAEVRRALTQHWPQ